MTDAMSGWGGYELSNRLSLSMRDREIVIDRTCRLPEIRFRPVHVLVTCARRYLRSVAWIG